MFSEQKPKPSGLATAQLILVGIVVFIVCLSVVLGVAGYLNMRSKTLTSLSVSQINAIEISADAKSILNVETKKIIFTIEDANKYLKDFGFAYNSDTFQNTNAKYAGDCFLSAVLSNNKDRVVFSSGCLAGDLPQTWVGVYFIPIYSCKKMVDGEEVCSRFPATLFNFLIGGSGRNFIWSSDDKTITYEADLGLSGMTETRTIDAVTGEIISFIRSDELVNWKIHTNEKYGFALTFSDTWRGYKAEEDKDNSNIIEFKLRLKKPDESADGSIRDYVTVFSLGIFSEKDWNKGEPDNFNRPAYLAKNDKYYFGYWTAQELSDNGIVGFQRLDGPLYDVNQILSTFKFTK